VQNLQQWWDPTGLSSPEDLPGLPENQKHNCEEVQAEENFELGAARLWHCGHKSFLGLVT
jgi:hypothetical protein